MAAGKKAGQDTGNAVANGIAASKAAVEKATTTLATAHNKAADAADKVTVAEAKLQTLLDKGVTDAGRLAKARADVAKANRDSEAAAGKVGTATAQLARAEDDAAKAAKNLGSESSSAGKRMGELSESTDKAEGNLGKFAKLAAAGAGLAFLGGKAIEAGKAFLDIGETFAGVNKTLQFTTGATGEKLDGMMESVKNIGKGSPKAFGEIADVLAKLSQRTGLTGTDLEYLTKQVMKTNAVMGQDTDINGLTAAFAAFGVQGKDASAALDELFKASRATGVGVNELAAQAVKGAPQFQQFGMSIGESAALMGSLDKAGINSDAVLTGLNKAMISFAKDGRKPKEALHETIGAIQNFTKAGNDAGALELAGKLFGTKGAGQFMNAVKSGAVTVEGLTAAMDESQKSVMDAGGAVPTLSSAWALFKNNAIIAIEPAATKVFGIFIEGLTWFRTTGVQIIQAVTGAFTGFLDGSGALSLVGAAFAGVRDTVVLFFNVLTGKESDIKLPWAGTVVDLAGKVKDAFDEVKGGFVAFKAAFIDGGDEVTSSGFAGFLEQLGVYARDVADGFQNYVVPPLKTFGEVLLTVGEVALPIVFDAVVLIKDILVGLGEAVFAVVNFFKDHDTAARVLAITVGMILLPTMVAMSVELVKQAILWTRTVVALTAYIIKGQILAARAKVDAAITAAAWVGAQIKIMAGWVSTAAGAVASFVSKTASAVVQAALTSSAWIGVQGRIAAGWIATKVTAVTSFVAKAASATAQAAVTSAVWLGSQAKVVAGWTATKAVAIASYIATSASASLEAIKSSAAWVASNAKTAASFLAAKISMLAVATATGVMTAAQWLLNAAVNANPFSLIVIALIAVGAGLYALWTKSETFRNIVTGAFNAVKNVVMGVWNWVSDNWPLLLAILTGPIGMAVLLITKNWDSIKEGAAAAKDWIVGKWNDLVGFVTGLPGRMRSAVSGMWDGVRDSFKSALNWVIDKWNNFRIPAMKVAGVQVSPEINFPDIPRFAAGGDVSGGTRGKDSVLAMLMPDEHVWTTKEVAAVGGHDAMFQMRASALAGNLPAFAGGGPVQGPGIKRDKPKSDFAGVKTTATVNVAPEQPTSTFYKDLYGSGSTPAAPVASDSSSWTANSGGSGTSVTSGGGSGSGTSSGGASTATAAITGTATVDGLVEFAKGIEGAPYVWGGVNWGDCSGAISAIANYVSGRAPFGSRFATMTEGAELAARGFQSGLGSNGSLNIGWYNGGQWGGHTAATLPNGTNFEMGGSGGNGQYGGSAAGARDSMFTDHAFLPSSFFAAAAGSPSGDDSTSSGGTSDSSSGGSSTSNEPQKVFSGRERVKTMFTDVAGIWADSLIEIGGVGEYLDLADRYTIKDSNASTAEISTPSTGIEGKVGNENIAPWIEQAQNFLSGVGLFDTGGVWEPGTFGFNGLKEPEHVLKNAHWKVAEGNMAKVDELVGAGVGGGGPRVQINNNQQVTLADQDSWQRDQASRDRIALMRYGG
ncbi:phage tail tape measure protein [Rhodococcus globerulus]|uniref:Phage tail tape measure protein n=1 Tax=Rhodococcus globerulus TaxID=33008 RepID=A0ABU4BS82_RHOGO|nr:phage tail tape measure protein [Rhodococcus globerulus]MDV6267081.1 phage tail tape measure protein [Rhodococcus globerulus]